jgi:2-keto-3-deoxy-6-phosphogluconate aldolase
MRDKLINQCVLPILAPDDLEVARMQVRVAMEYHLTCFEILYRSAVNLEILAELRQLYPQGRDQQAYFLAGSIQSKEEAERAQRAGADGFVSAGGYDPEIGKLSGKDYLYVPTFTSSPELLQALRGGTVMQKYFPAQDLGVPYLSKILKPFTPDRMNPVPGRNAPLVMITGGIQITDDLRETWDICPAVRVFGTSDLLVPKAEEEVREKLIDATLTMSDWTR